MTLRSGVIHNALIHCAPLSGSSDHSEQSDRHGFGLAGTSAGNRLKTEIVRAFERRLPVWIAATRLSANLDRLGGDVRVSCQCACTRIIAQAGWGARWVVPTLR